jgi:hypothetical protein
VQSNGAANDRATGVVVTGKAKATNEHSRRDESPSFPSLTEDVSEPESSCEDCDDELDEGKEYSDGDVVLELDEKDKQAAVHDDWDFDVSTSRALSRTPLHPGQNHP